jgi:replicative DNA helicase
MANPTAPDTDRLPPHSPEAEQGVLGCILLSPNDCLGQCLEKLHAGKEAFYDLRHQTIYDALMEMHDKGEAIDIITLQQQIKDKNRLDEIGGIPYLNALQDGVPSAANLSYYLEIVMEKFLLRKIIHTCTDVVGRVYEYEGEVDTLLDEVERGVLSIQRSETSATLDGKTAGLRMVDDLERRHQLNGALSGLDTGLYDLNKITEGLQFGEQAVIGARPAQGKTALGLGIFCHIVSLGIPAMFISMEMSVEAVMRRMVAIKTSVPLKEIRRGNYSEDDFTKFSAFQSWAAKSPMHIIDGVDGFGIRQLCARVRRHVLRFSIKLVVIDYLQKIRPSERHEKRTYEVGEISGRLKSLAVETNVAMLTLAQLNRENTRDKGRAPRLSDLADSGQIERDADLVMLIHRQGDDTKLLIAKQRDGETGCVNLNFNGEFCKFSNRSYANE